VDLHAVLPTAHSNDAVALDPIHPAMADHPDQTTVALRAGDAVVLDYRLLHGTHPHTGDEVRDTILLSFTPAWNALPDELRAHLIQHPAQPRPNEPPMTDSPMTGLLPSYGGIRRDLALNRDAPKDFVLR
jgi:hypothetical protein